MNSYPYANGAIKSLENKILNRNKIYRLAKGDHQNFLKSLVDAGFGTDSSSLEALIASEEVRTKEVFKINTPNKDLTDLFFISTDARNIKYYYKKKLYNIASELTLPSGAIDNELLEKAIIEGLETGNKHLDNVVKMINKEIKDNTDAREVSKIVETSLFNYAMDKSKHNKCLHTYYEVRLDTINLLTFIRSKRLNWDYKKFKEMYFKGGSIKLEVFEKAYDMPKDTYVSQFKDYKNGKVVKYLNDFIVSTDLNDLEQALNQLVIDEMANFKNDSFDIGPIIYYYLEKEAEISNIRLAYANENIETSELLNY